MEKTIFNNLPKYVDGQIEREPNNLSWKRFKRDYQ